MSDGLAIPLLLAVALVAANLPWASDRVALVYRAGKGHKAEWIRLLEWLVLFFLVALVGAGLEMRTQGQLQSQGWEFWVIGLCLFAVFALPGFIYHHDLRRRLAKRHWRGSS